MADSINNERLAAVIETQREIAAADLEIDALMDLVVRRAQGISGAAGGVIELVDGDELVYSAVSGTATPCLGHRLPLDTTLAGLAISIDQVLRCDDSERDDRVDQEACLNVGAKSMVCVPLRHGDGAVGVLQVFSPDAGVFDEDDVQALELLAGMVAVHMARASELVAAAPVGRHDALTGLGNRRAYDERIVREVERARRYGHPLSLVLVDLEGLAKVNEEHGQAVGDEALRGAGAILREDIRLADESFRIGGDAFAILLPETTLENAWIVAERLRARIAEAKLSDGQVSSSFGVAESVGDTLGLHAAASEALAAAKSSGSGAAAFGLVP